MQRNNTLNSGGNSLFRQGVHPPVVKRPRIGKEDAIEESPNAPESDRLALTEATTTTTTTKNENEEPAVQDPMGLLLMSFPFKLHVMLARCESEHSRTQTTNRAKKTFLLQNEEITDSHKENATVVTESTVSVSSSERRTLTRRGNYNNDAVIGWLSNGRSFKIYDEERFVREIMPLYFLHHDSEETGSLFETFTRNLELWGFTRATCVEGPTTRLVHVCQHPFFVKGDPGLCRHMKFRVFPSSFREP